MIQTRALFSALLASIWAACAPEPPREPARAPNVLLVSLDTLRADRAFGASTHGGGVMPNLEQFARESIVFDQAYSQSNETPFSHASLLTGRYPTELGRMDYSFRMPAEVPSLQSVLHAYGYRTGAFVGGAFLSKAFGFEAGFDTFASPRDWGSLWHTAPLALAWIDAQADVPWFALVHGYDMHSPYAKPAPLGQLHRDPRYGGPALSALAEPTGTDRIIDGNWYASPPGGPVLDMWTNRVRTETNGRTAHRLSPDARPITSFSDADTDAVRLAYDAAASWVDTLFGLFIADLAARGHLDNTVIVVVSDHGEELGEHGAFNHRWGLSEEVLHVPLLVRLPGAKGGGQRVSSVVALLDVLPTVLGLVGATAPAGTHGQALVAPGGVITAGNAARSAFAEGTCRAVAERSAAGLTVFAGLSADSPYLADAIAKSPATAPFFVGAGAGQARETLSKWRATLTLPASASSTRDPGLESALQQHGYWGAQ